jgi:hypothetical protein
MPEKLTQNDYIEAAKLLRSDISNIMSVAENESLDGGFLPDGRPKILFERHKFRKYSNGRFDNSHPHLSNDAPGGYKGGAAEWVRFEAAAKLNRKAAMMAISMGKFQIMGFNYKLAGFDSVEAFFEAMHVSEGEHLKAFCHFVINSGLDDELRKEDFVGFASGFNGKYHAKNNYAPRMEASDNKFEARGVDHWKTTVQVVPPPPISETPNPAVSGSPVTTDPPAETEQKTTTEFSIDNITQKVESANTTITTVSTIAGKASDSVKAFRTMISLKSLGAVVTTIGAFVHDRWLGFALIFVGIIIVVLIGWKYMTRQEKIGVARVNNNQ